MSDSPLPNSLPDLCASSATAPLKVLIADDSPLATKMLSSILRRVGYDVVTASDGIEAAQAVYRELPCVILVDIFMPRMNGYQVWRLIKQDCSVAQIPVLINTASESRSAEFWSLHTGANGFVLKGIAPEELLSAVSRVTEGRVSFAPGTVPREVSAEEILFKVCALVDQELYAATVKSMELQTMLSNMSEGILTVDLASCISNANHFFCDIFDLSESELQGRDCGLGLGGAVGAATSRLVEAALRGEAAASQASEVLRRDGTVTPVAISAVAVTDYLGEVVGAVCVFQDITDMIVHDLRTPLTALLTGMESIEMLGDMNADQSELLNISIEGGQILLSMINDFARHLQNGRRLDAT